MKKLLLSLGTISAVIAPVATVVACGNSEVKILMHVSRDTAGKLNKIDVDITASSIEQKFKDEGKNLRKIIDGGKFTSSITISFNSNSKTATSTFTSTTMPANFSNLTITGEAFSADEQKLINTFLTAAR